MLTTELESNQPNEEGQDADRYQDGHRVRGFGRWMRCYEGADPEDRLFVVHHR
jgi:hypothetical protein